MYRSFRTPTIWREMNRLQRDRLMNYYSPGQAAAAYPALNIWASDEGHFITAEMPGVRADELEISIEGDTLTIQGERSADQVPEDAQYHRRERIHGKFSRSIQLPFAVDSKQVEASFTDGVLKITMPRVEAEKPRKIEIK